MTTKEIMKLAAADAIVGDIRELMRDVREEVRIKLEAERRRYKDVDKNSVDVTIKRK